MSDCEVIYKFVCESCNYPTNSKYKYERHLSSVKHKKKTKNLEDGEKKKYCCEACGRSYKFRQGLSFHRKKCTGNNDTKSLIETQRKEIEELRARIELLESTIAFDDKKKCKKNLCRHLKNKGYCKECGGSALCVHNKDKRYCKECGGSALCVHNKDKKYCKECGGSSICVHNKDKKYCKECGGSSICVHNKDKRYCKECGGSALCVHNKDKKYCRECGGSAICIHNKDKRHCRECGGSLLCKNEWCETSVGNKYEGYCMPCFVNNPENRDKPAMKNYKTKEKAVVEFIQEVFSDFTWNVDKRVDNGCSRRRPDLLLDMGSQIIIVEIDENSHSTYDCSCENKRLMELSRDLQHRPIVFIRFNPDKYTSSDGNVIQSCWELTKQGVLKIRTQVEWNKRLNVLKEQIQYWVDNLTDKMVEIVELFY